MMLYTTVRRSGPGLKARRNACRGIEIVTVTILGDRTGNAKEGASVGNDGRANRQAADKPDPDRASQLNVGPNRVRCNDCGN